MTDLPISNKLPIHHLSTCFNNVTNSYKFYWFLAILDSIAEQQVIPIEALLANMIASVWYPTNYFKLSFGKQDRLGIISLKVNQQGYLKKSDIASEVLNQLSAKTKTSKQIRSLGRFVPYRFLRPFFERELRGVPDWKIERLIVELVEQSFNDKTNLPLYRFVNDRIEIQEDWFKYLQQHIHILRGFCLWHLLNYLQKNNPNVPNIAQKLFVPEQRDLKQAKKFWKIVFSEIGTIQCVYSNQVITETDFSLDHFLPWRFVTHDLLWNIVPASKPVNSAKGDNLPNLKMYFDKFAQVQYSAVQIIADTNKTKMLEDYIMLFKQSDVTGIKTLEYNGFRQVLWDTISPQVQIAQNMGFISNWSYVSA